MRVRDFVFGCMLLAALTVVAWETHAQPREMDGDYYKDFPLFHMYPQESGRDQWSVYRFGPVGIGVDLTLPAFGMRIRNVEEGSPAAEIGQLKVGQIVESINGRTLKDIDPRVILGNIITEVEATDGIVRLVVKDNADAPAQEVVVQIPVLGAYSPTWPLNCAKSDKIVRGVADYLSQPGNLGNGIGHDQRLLFLLSTGDDRDLEVVRTFIHDLLERNYGGDTNQMIPWAIGYGAPALCEYYLRTGDEAVLPLIKRIADQAARLMYNGGWNQRTVVNFRYGHMNAAGVHVLRFLLLAKECGVDVDEYTLQTSLRHFFRYTARGNVSYGDTVPERGFVDNGKVGGLAFAMQAAANLTPDGENSIYARARDISAIKGFYSTSWMLHGHTGGGIGEIWRSGAMGLMYDRNQTKYREFMDNRMWHYELSRRFDGSMAILADKPYSRGYDNPIWGAGYAMTYTIPRKTLRMTGAPPTQFSRQYQLPERLWGNAADDAFYSLIPAADENGRRQDIDAERLATHASWPALRRLQDPNVTDELLLKYVRHPEYNMRQQAAGHIRNHARDHLIMPLLRDKDPRVRHAGVMVIVEDTGNRVYIPRDRFTEEMQRRLAEMIVDPDEAWWTVANAMMALSQADPDLLAEHIDVFLGYLRQDEWWLHRSAMAALVPLSSDPSHARKIIPAVARLASQNTVGGSVQFLPDIVQNVANGPEEIKELALRAFGVAYQVFPTDLRAPGGADMRNALPHLQGRLAEAMTRFPGGYDALYRISREIMPDVALPYQNLFFRADTSQFGPELAAALPDIILREVIPEFIGANLDRVLAEGRWMSELGRTGMRKDYAFAVSELDDLVALYNQAGIHDYDWRTYGPERDQIAWDYHGFDLDEPWQHHANPKAYYDPIFHARGRLGRAERDLSNAVSRLERDQEELRRAQDAYAENSSDRHKASVARIEERVENWQNTVAAAEAERQLRMRQRDQAMLFDKLPAGLENWFAPEFRPDAAGWWKGRAPFANNGGELKHSEWRCRTPFCFCSAEPNTFWENDVLLLRTTIEVPPLKEENRYRVLVGGNIHSRKGGPITVYLNGKPMHQQGGFGGRLRGKPRGFLIDKDMVEEFQSGKVHIAIAAVRTDPAYLTAWLEEMKIPPLGERELFAARLRRPMASSEWQELQDPDVRTQDPNEGKYRFSGRIVDNPVLRGTWRIIAEVARIEDFAGAADADSIEDAPFAQISFGPNGRTDQWNWVWTENILMALEQGEALQIQTSRVGGKDYLFIEKGGFNNRHPREWTSPLYVLERQ